MKQQIHTVEAPQAIGAYSQAIQQGNTVYFSGQIPLDPQSMMIISDDFKEQAIQVFKNLQAVSKAANGDLDKLVKLTIFLTDLKYFPIVNEVMMQLFKEPFPARSTVEVSALPKSALIEVEAIMTLL